ncbi:MAG: AAA family ATPase [Chloroflexi bacterium]|nr:AAA family ATPase [Chloroflexota bacterium]
MVARPELFALLSAAAAGGVTLVSAPAGSGKTVLLRSWIEDAGLSDRLAWVGVDRGEQDTQRFWLCVVESLREIKHTRELVTQAAPTPDFDGTALVDRLLSQLGSLEEPLVLVIDDLHELQSSVALAQLETLLTRRPPLLHVVLASRHDPGLGLHRLRLNQQLTEIRASDLRFTLEAARELLGDSGIELSDESVSALHARTEGWAAGLRLAALSLARHPEPKRFVAEFTGSERTVAEYLLAEVLERQTEEVRRLLLRTSILERVNGAVADVLVGTSGSERILQELEAANAFIVALDAERSWFRYHHLFADLLRLELRRTEPEALVQLHRAAAEWYTDHRFVIDAIRHTQAAEDWKHAAELTVDHTLSLALNGQHATLTALISAFPYDAPPSAELALLFAYRELIQRSLDGAAAYLSLADRYATDMPDVRNRRFEVVLAVTRLTLARRRGDFAAVLEKVRALLDPADAETLSDVSLTNEVRAVALMNLGIAELWAYRRDEARRHLEQGLELAQRIGMAYVEVGCLSHLAALDAWRSFALVRERCGKAIAIADAHGWSTDPIVCLALAMLGLMDVSQGRFDSAQAWLDRAVATLPADLEPATALVIERARGMLHVGRGRLEEALGAFRAAERLQGLLVTPHPLVAQMREWRVLMLLRLGRLQDARAALADFSDQEREWGEARTAVASVCLAEGEVRAAAETLADVLDGTLRVLHAGSLAEALLVDAMACDRLGDAAGAERDIERALEIAEPDAQVFPFVLTRPVEVLQRHPRQRTAHAALLSELLDLLADSTLQPRSREPLILSEGLSDSEQRVLGYLPSNLSAPEIAAELCVSTSTIKTHMRQIYAKLDVHKRTDAVQRARDLGLLGPSARALRRSVG